MRQKTVMNRKERESIILGVTGGIASGKSSVVEMFRKLGAQVVSADILAREVVEPGSPMLEDLVAAFGRQILTSEGGLDRKAMADIVFSDPEARYRLNAIMHPAIARLADQRLQEAAAQGPLVLYEAPLLFEAGAEKRVDRVLVVTLSEGMQLQRLMARDHFTESEAKSRIRSQMSQAQKVARADYVIDNSGTPEQTWEAVRKVFSELTKAMKEESSGRDASSAPGGDSSRG